MKIKGFKSFLEAVTYKKQECSYYFSQRLREIIYYMHDSGIPCASYLINIEASNKLLDDITFFDISDDDSTISFIQTNRLVRIKEMDSSSKDLTLDQWARRIWRSTSYNLDSVIWKEQRTTIGIGRFLTRFFQKSNLSVTDREKEEFVNAFKSRFKLLNNAKDRFEMSSGEDIRKWYSEKSYELNKGQLSSSCMRYDTCQSFFDIYIKNPEVCQLLILHGLDSNKIIGRSLIWTLTSGQTYMDRVYTNIESDKNLFFDYAKEQGWSSRHGSNVNTIEVQLKKYEYKDFPYMDTFMCYNHITNKLSNDEDNIESTDWWELQETDGGHSVGGRVWSDFHDEYIDRDDAVMCVDIEDWVRSEDAIYLEYKDIWVSNNCDDTCYSTVDDRTYYVDDCSYSESLDTYIYDAIQVYVSPDDKDYFPTAYLESGQVTKVNIDDEEKFCLLDSIVLDPYINKWFFKLDRIEGMTYTEYLVNKINEEKIDKSKLYNYLISLKPTDDIIVRINKYFNKIYYRIVRFFKDNDKFNIIKLSLWFMYPDNDKSNSKSGLYSNALDNTKVVNDFMGESSDSLLSNTTFFDYFIPIAKILMYDIITDSEMLKAYIAMKMSTI